MQNRSDITVILHHSKLTYWTQIQSENHKHKCKPSVCMWGNSSRILFVPKTVFTPETMFEPKTICIFSSHSFWVSKFRTTIGEALIDLVCQYPALWDKQDGMYKDSSYKDAKWKEIAEILHLTKEDVIKKSLRDTYVRHKNIKSKSGDGLSQCKPKWKYYDIMSFIDITLLKWRYVPIYLTTSYIQHTYIQ